jgi:uncharacterized membrane-anchored protein
VQVLQLVQVLQVQVLQVQVLQVQLVQVLQVQQLQPLVLVVFHRVVLLQLVHWLKKKMNLKSLGYKF